MLSIVMLNIIMLNVDMLNAVILSVIHHAGCRTPRILPLSTGEKNAKKFTFYFKNGLAFWSLPRSDSYLIEVILGYWIIWTKLTLMN
jgi:hypothetical protein